MPETVEMTESTNDEKYLIFSIVDRLYAFPAQIIGEVAKCDAIYPLPLLPPYVLGVINRYSIPYALFDIGSLLFQTSGSRKEALVIKGEIDRVAFLIDSVTGIANIAPGKLIDMETGTEPNELTSAVCASFNWNGSNVFLLDIQRILTRVSQEEEIQQ
jgi:purine-binding chemotaxis protein CheW